MLMMKLALAWVCDSSAATVKSTAALLRRRLGRWCRFSFSLSLCAAQLLIVHWLGLFERLSQQNYHTYFNYPLAGNVSQYVDLLLQGQEPPVTPLNTQQFRYLAVPRSRCSHEEHASPLQLVLVIKSTVDHFQRRRAIRASWAEQRAGVGHVFLLGTRVGEPALQRAVEHEAKLNGDIVQAHFQDAYHNNTLKTMSGIRWVVEQCGDAEYALFVDDDMYVSVSNVLRLAREREEYPREEGATPLQEQQLEPLLLAGYVYQSAVPQRHRSSKWFVSVKEYPFSLWPPYVPGGAFLVSRETLRRLLFTSYYTKLFWIDDVYLGLVAKKAGLRLLHTEYVWLIDKPGYSPEGYRHVVAAHGYHEPHRLLRVWRDQRRLGQA